jgi:hypothetical protein
MHTLDACKGIPALVTDLSIYQPGIATLATQLTDLANLPQWQRLYR